MSENELIVEIERIKNYKFKLEFDKESMGEVITDETKSVGGDEEGPNPSRLLAGATLNCLMASLIFCLNKKRVELKSMRGKVTGTVNRVDKRLRVTDLKAEIYPEINEKDKEKLEACKKIFEDYCVVTQSVKNGINVNVEVEPEV
ncbi:MAG: OsmC family protein [Thermoplasmatota archaeon]